MILPAAASLQRLGGRGYLSGYCVHYYRFFLPEVLRQAFSWVGGYPQDCPPNFRETRISHSNCFASLRGVGVDGEIYGRRKSRK